MRLEAREFRLPDSKTGPRIVPLSPAAAEILAGVPRIPGHPWVVPRRRAAAHLSGIFLQWRCARSLARFDDVRLHDLRHTFASRALALGEPLPMIGKLLGHTKIQTTARYAHLARDSIRDSAVQVAVSIAEDILPPETPKPGRR